MMMKKSCLSSIPSSFASVSLVSFLFAMCVISFLYIHPRENSCINVRISRTKVINLSNEQKLTTPLAASEYASNVPTTDTLVNSTATYEDVANSTSVDIGVNSTAPYEDVANLTTVDIGVNSTASSEQIPNSTPFSMLTSNEIVANSAPAENVSNSTPIDIERNNEVINSTTPTENLPTATLIEIPLDDSKLVKSPAPTTTTTNLEEETEEDDPMPSYDVLSYPPWNVSKEVRIAWLLQKLPESGILKSTTKTRKFDAKIQQFFNGQGDDTSCKVRFFMTWISSASLFGKRELISLESVLKAHPEGCVVIVSKSMDSKPGRLVLQPLLDRGHRVLAVSPDIPLLLSNTPGQGWLERLEAGDVDPGTVPITQNLSNLLRIVVLYKYGGVYLDTDIIIIKDISAFRNAIGIQSVDDETRTWRTLNNAVLIFDKEHPLLFKFMEEFAWNFDGSEWGHNGPKLATRVVQRVLEDTNIQFRFLSTTAFYPVDWLHIPGWFEEPMSKNDTTWTQDKFKEINGESYGIHLWNSKTRSLKISKRSVIGRLISDHCIICQDVYDS